MEAITPHYTALGLLKAPEIVKLGTSLLLRGYFNAHKHSNLNLSLVSEVHDNDCVILIIIAEHAMYEKVITHQTEKIGLTTVRPYAEGDTISMRGQLHFRHYLSHYVIEGRRRRYWAGVIACVTRTPHKCAPEDTRR